VKKKKLIVNQSKDSIQTRYSKMPTLFSSSESQYQRQLYTLPPTEKGVETKPHEKKQNIRSRHHVADIITKTKSKASGNHRGHRHGGLVVDRIDIQCRYHLISYHVQIHSINLVVVCTSTLSLSHCAMSHGNCIIPEQSTTSTACPHT